MITAEKNRLRFAYGFFCVNTKAYIFIFFYVLFVVYREKSPISFLWQYTAIFYFMQATNPGLFPVLALTGENR